MKSGITMMSDMQQTQAYNHNHQTTCTTPPTSPGA